jgi:hypothetical protein
MPIQFPPAPQWTSLNDASKLFKVPGVQMQPNLARVGSPFTQNTFNPGIAVPAARAVNVRQLGVNYTAPTETARVNPAMVVAQCPCSNNYVAPTIMKRQTGRLNMAIMGVTRDVLNAAMPNARVMVFRTSDNEFIDEITSDAAGNYSILMLRSGPFFIVVYKVGAPDVTGATLNNIVPVQV